MLVDIEILFTCDELDVTYTLKTDMKAPIVDGDQGSMSALLEYVFYW